VISILICIRKFIHSRNEALRQRETDTKITLKQEFMLISGIKAIRFERNCETSIKYSHNALQAGKVKRQQSAKNIQEI